MGYVFDRTSLFSSQILVTTCFFCSPFGSVRYMTNTNTLYCVGVVLHSILLRWCSVSNVLSISFLFSGPSWYIFVPMGAAFGWSGMDIHSVLEMSIKSPVLNHIG